MSERTFLDTNVLLYAEDSRDPRKQHRARAVFEEVVRDGNAVLSTQVLQEYFVGATRKLGTTPELAHARVEAMSRLEVVIIRPELVLAAIDLHRLRSISFWDALVIRAAAVSGCKRVLTEDLNHGQLIDGVRVENPFLS